MLFISWYMTCKGSFLFLVAEFLRSEVMSCRREIRKLVYRVVQVKEKLIARANELTEVSSCKHSWHLATGKAVFMSVLSFVRSSCLTWPLHPGKGLSKVIKPTELETDGSSPFIFVWVFCFFGFDRRLETGHFEQMFRTNVPEICRVIWLFFCNLIASLRCSQIMISSGIVLNYSGFYQLPNSRYWRVLSGF